MRVRAPHARSWSVAHQQPWRPDRPLRDASQLLEHGEVITDGPPFGDARVAQSVGEGDVAGADPGGQVEPAERAAGPLQFASTELDHDVVLGDDDRLGPPARVL